MYIRAVQLALFLGLFGFTTTYTTASHMAVVDFESFGASLGEGGHVTSTTVAGVTITFSTKDASGTYSPWIAQVGELTNRVAFQSVLGDDTPIDTAGNVYTQGGEYSLTDGIRVTRDYVFDFSEPVNDFQLDVYDFRADGTFQVGVPGADTVNLLAYDVTGSIIGSTSYTVPDPRPTDGNVITLGFGDLGNISQVQLDFNSVEGGTAVDNLAFMVGPRPVPEPNQLGCVAFVLAGLFHLRRRFG